MQRVSWTDKNKLNVLPSGQSQQSSHRSDGDHSVQGFTVFYFASFCFDADQVSEVLKVEEQQVVAKVQERQTLQGREDGQRVREGFVETDLGQRVLENIYFTYISDNTTLFRNMNTHGHNLH